MVHAVTAPRLRETCGCLARDLPFAEQVALMGPETRALRLRTRACCGSTRSIIRRILRLEDPAIRLPRQYPEVIWWAMVPGTPPASVGPMDNAVVIVAVRARWCCSSTGHGS
jgi:hypothetical protein